ncbi:MAG: sulfatase-like hydrolase/transferase, partial [Promethearchaeota archaeon]
MPDHPNVLYIITHDQGIAINSLQGAGPMPSVRHGIPTPNLDEIAKKGVLLSNHFSTCPLCTPARGSLMTGQYPHVNGLVGLVHRGFSFNEGFKTVLHVFKEAGYDTTLVGFQHEIKNEPTLLGYDDFRATQFIDRCHWLLDDIEDVFKRKSRQ